MLRALAITLLVLAAARAVFWADTHRPQVKAWFARREPPDESKAAAVDPVIMRAYDQRLIRQVSREYGVVNQKIDEARAQGFRVDEQERTLMLSLELARRKQYGQAVHLLNRVEMSVPRKQKEAVRPAGEEEAFAEPEPEFKMKAPSRSKVKRRRRSR